MTKVRYLQRLPTMQREGLRVLMLVIASWDVDLFAHSEQVAFELLRLAPADREEEWYWAGLLHDVGKLAVGYEIFCKRGALTQGERKLMQQHPLKGAILLQGIGAPLRVVQAAKFHHERWDGTGYPYDIRGERIPVIARVLAVADAFNTLTSDRPYRRALPPTRARLEIGRNAGTQFDPGIVAQFFEEKKNGEG